MPVDSDSLIAHKVAHWLDRNYDENEISAVRWSEILQCPNPQEPQIVIYVETLHGTTRFAVIQLTEKIESVFVGGASMDENCKKYVPKGADTPYINNEVVAGVMECLAAKDRILIISDKCKIPLSQLDEPILTQTQRQIIFTCDDIGWSKTSDVDYPTWRQLLLYANRAALQSPLQSLYRLDGWTTDRRHDKIFIELKLSGDNDEWMD